MAEFKKQFELSAEFRERREDLDPQQQRLEAFETAAIAQLREIVGAGFDEAKSEKRSWRGEGGRIEQTRANIRERVLSVIEKNTAGTSGINVGGGQRAIEDDFKSPDKVRDNLAKGLGRQDPLEARIWKANYPKQTLDALRSQKKTAESSLIVLEGMEMMLGELSHQARLEMEQEKARLQEYEAGITTLAYLKGVSEKERKQVLRHLGFEGKNASATSALEEVIAELKSEVTELKGLKTAEIQKQKAVFEQELDRARTPQEKAGIWKAIQAEIKSPDTPSPDLNKYLWQSAQNIPLANRLVIYRELGFDHAKSLEEAEQNQKMIARTRQEAAERVRLMGSAVSYDKYLEALQDENTGAKVLDRSVKTADIVAALIQDLGKKRELADDQTLTAGEKLNVLLLSGSSPSQRVAELSPATQDLLLTYIVQLDKQTKPVEDTGDVLTEEAETSLKSAKEQQTAFIDIAKEAEKITKLEDLKDQDIDALGNPAWSVFLINFEKAHGDFEAARWNTNDKAKIGPLWEELQAQVEALKKVFAEWKKDQTNKAQREAEIKAFDEKIGKTKPNRTDFESGGLVDEKAWGKAQAEYKEALRKRPDEFVKKTFTKVRVDTIKAKLDIAQEKSEVKTKKAREVPAPLNQRLNAELRKEVRTQLETEVIEDIARTQEEEFRVISRLKEGATVTITFSDMIKQDRPGLESYRDEYVSTYPEAIIIESGDTYVIARAKGSKELIVVQNDQGRSNIGVYQDIDLPKDYDPKSPLPMGLELPKKPNKSGIALGLISPLNANPGGTDFSRKEHFAVTA